MAVSTKAVRIGVIDEERNDIEVIYELTCKIIKENEFSFSTFIGHGCGKVRRKCKDWAENLLVRGCTGLVVVHDLDKRVEKELRKNLEQEIRTIKFRQAVVLIPIEELEAWLLSDPIALMAAFHMQRAPKLPKHPENIESPKEYLAKVVRSNSKTQYLNTVHNRNIAKKISIASLDKCPSFSRYPEFLRTVFPQDGSRV
jgi:hypothetical protein